MAEQPGQGDHEEQLPYVAPIGKPKGPGKNPTPRFIRRVVSVLIVGTFCTICLLEALGMATADNDLTMGALIGLVGIVFKYLYDEQD